MTIGDPTHWFFEYGSQYYVAGRYPAFAGLTPIVGNILHHAVEMFLKGGLAKTMALDEMKRKLGHDLPKIWAAFKAQAGDKSLLAFDKVIDTLNNFEDIRYPDQIMSDGAALQIDITKAGAAMTSGSGSGASLPQYSLCLEEIDELVKTIFNAASRTPAVYLRFIKSEARDYVNRENNAFTK